MENMIEVGEYIRNNKIIAKVIGTDDDNNILLDIQQILTKPEEKTVKHSKQLIDLIEVKDVIKYRINNISTTLETKGYIEGIVDISDEEMLQGIKNDNDYHILEILTKEQFEANCYKVGGEDE